MLTTATHWKSLYYSDREFYDLCYWRAAEYYASEHEELEDSPAGLEVVYGSRMAVLTLGQIDGEASSLFGWGYCGYLALAVHDLTGVPFALFTSRRDDTESGWSGHAAVALPDGSFLDIEGVVSAAEISSRYRFPEPVEPTFPDRETYLGIMFGQDHVADPYYSLDPLEIRLLRHFAELVARRAGIDFGS